MKKNIEKCWTLVLKISYMKISWLLDKFLYAYRLQQFKCSVYVIMNRRFFFCCKKKKKNHVNINPATRGFKKKNIPIVLALTRSSLLSRSRSQTVRLSVEFRREICEWALVTRTFWMKTDGPVFTKAALYWHRMRVQTKGVYVHFYPF